MRLTGKIYRSAGSDFRARGQESDDGRPVGNRLRNDNRAGSNVSAFSRLAENFTRAPRLPLTIYGRNYFSSPDRLWEDEHHGKNRINSRHARHARAAGAQRGRAARLEY